jgi:general secretion pathway protein C
MPQLSLENAGDYLQQLLAKRWVVWAINLAALTLLTYSMAQWTWRFVSPKPAAAPAPALAPQAASRAQDLQTVLSASLFGQSAASGPTRQLPLEAIPVTSLNLVLTGVVVTQTGSFALMSIDGAPEAPVAVGQPLTAGATLQAVYSDRAILVRGGTQEAVLLKDSQSAPGAAGAGVTYSVPQGPAVTQLAANQFSVNRDQLTQQMQTPEFLSQALIVPHAGGGFMVRDIKPGSLYEKLGLKVGDIIQSVNGQSISTIEDVMRIYQQMGGSQAAAQIDIEVTRAGKPQRLQYSLQ